VSLKILEFGGEKVKKVLMERSA